MGHWKDSVAFLICLEACMMPPNALKTSTRGGFSSGLLDPVSVVHNGFNNMDLPFISVVRPSTISNSRSFMDNPEEQLKIGFFMPAWYWGGGVVRLKYIFGTFW